MLHVTKVLPETNNILKQTLTSRQVTLHEVSGCTLRQHFDTVILYTQPYIQPTNLACCKWQQCLPTPDKISTMLLPIINLHSA